MKVVFLDFDGPIIPIMSHEHRRGLREKAWPSCIDELNRITDVTGAKIVISSTWRLGGGSEARRLLGEWGCTGDVIDITPDLSRKVSDDPGGIWITVCRGEEISDWLGRNVTESFVIIDDDDDMAHLKEFLVQTPFETGLTRELSDKAISILGVKEEARLVESCEDSA